MNVLLEERNILIGTVVTRRNLNLVHNVVVQATLKERKKKAWLAKE